VIKTIRLAGLCAGILTANLNAQQTVTTSGATIANTVPLFAGPSSVGNSVITQVANGAIAVKGNLVLDTTSMPIMADGTYVIASGGRIRGEYILSLEGSYRTQTVHLLVNANQFDGNSTLQVLENHSYSLATMMSNFRLLISVDGQAEYLVVDIANRGTSSPGTLFVQYQGSGTYGAYFGGTLTGNETAVGVVGLVSNEGNTGIGTLFPGAKLEVNGNVKLTSGSGASLTFADGTVQSTAWSGSLVGGDYAESVDVTGDRQKYEPGDVLVIDPSHPGQFLKSAEPYTPLVSGIYSTKPGVTGRRQTTDPRSSTMEVPMAMVGIVPTKVSAENGPINVGDLLVTSSTLGYAMKGTDQGLMFGAVVGKALDKLESGTGVIEVMVTLQ
jgi:hypothetical protein